VKGISHDLIWVSIQEFPWSDWGKLRKTWCSWCLDWDSNLSDTIRLVNQIITARAILHGHIGSSGIEQEVRLTTVVRRENATMMIENVHKFKFWRVKCLYLHYLGLSYLELGIKVEWAPIRNYQLTICSNSEENIFGVLFTPCTMLQAESSRVQVPMRWIL
jgi:hypothetical protein